MTDETVASYSFTTTKAELQKAWDETREAEKAASARLAALVDAAENVVIAHQMGWDMEGTVEVLTEAVSPFTERKAPG